MIKKREEFNTVTYRSLTTKLRKSAVSGRELARKVAFVSINPNGCTRKKVSPVRVVKAVHKGNKERKGV